MGKKYFDTKAETLESSILGVWSEAAKKVAETNKNDKSDDGDGLDAVQPKAVKKKFKDRKDKDIDNDGDTDDSDEFLHKKRTAISKAMKDEGNAFGKALMAAKEKGDKTFVVAGKTYEVYEEVDLDEGKMSQLHQYIKDKKSAEEIAKLMKVDVKTIKTLMSSYESTDGDNMGENSKYMEMLAAACGAPPAPKYGSVGESIQNEVEES